MDAKKLRGYAELIVRTGAAVQPGQDVVVCAELDRPDFVELIVEECYKAGAAQVRVEWSHQALQLLNVKYQSVDRLGSMAEWER